MYNKFSNVCTKNTCMYIRINKNTLGRIGGQKIIGGPTRMMSHIWDIIMREQKIPWDG